MHELLVRRKSESSSSSSSSADTGGGGILAGEAAAAAVGSTSATNPTTKPQRPVVNWSCDSGNVPSRKIAEKLGFVFAGNVCCFEYAGGSRAQSNPRAGYAEYEK